MYLQESMMVTKRLIVLILGINTNQVVYNMPLLQLLQPAKAFF
jgi:hypothetical protein